MADQDKRPSFTCYNCKQVNYYRTSDYVSKNQGGELLMEMLTRKTKDVSITCSNQTCKCLNTVTITYI